MRTLSFIDNPDCERVKHFETKLRGVPGDLFKIASNARVTRITGRAVIYICVGSVKARMATASANLALRF